MDLANQKHPEASAPLEPGPHRLRAPRPLAWPEPADGCSVPTRVEILEARELVRHALGTTPLEHSPGLSRRFRREIYVKLENCSPIRSFKARGAIAALGGLDPEQRRKGVITASTGNHGQGIALAGLRVGAPVTVVVPSGTADVKVRAMSDLEAAVIVAGESLVEAETVAIELAEQKEFKFIHDGEDPGLMAGAATVVWEMLEAQPDLDTVIVPVGGGNLVAASLLSAQMLRPDLSVVGVQSVAAPGATLSWLEGSIQPVACWRMFAAGLATDQPGRLSLTVLTTLLTQMILFKRVCRRRSPPPTRRPAIQSRRPAPHQSPPSTTSSARFPVKKSA